MGIKGIKIEGTTYHIDYEYLENKPSMPPAVTVSDVGKILTVNANGEWEAMSQASN